MLVNNTCKLCELCTITKGKKVSVLKTRTKKSIPYLLINTLRGVEPDSFTEDKKYTEAISSDILIVCDGANSGLVGTGLKGAVGSTIARLRMNDLQKIDKDYFMFFLESNFAKMNQDIKGAAIPHLKQKEMLDMDLWLPSLLIQQKIVSEIEKQFSRLDESEKELKETLRKLDLYKKSVLKEAFRMREGWEEKELGEAFEVVMGQSPKSSDYNLDGKGLAFFQGKKDFNYRVATVTTWTHKWNKEVDKGDLLVSIRAPIGPCNITPERCAIGRGIAGIKAKDECDSLFLFHLIQSVSQKLDSLGTGTTFKAISKDNLKSVLVNIPKSKQTQQEIVSAIEQKFSVVDSVKAEVEGALKKVGKLRKSILKSAFEGRLVQE